MISCFHQAAPAAIKRGIASLAVIITLLACGSGMAKDAVKEGAPLDVSAWQYRKPVTFNQPGVIRVELDSDVLAHATHDQGDVRVMQDGRQLPYVIERALPLRELDLTFKEESDAKHPTLSRWRIDLPVAGHPLETIEATSPTPLFDRQVNLWEEARDTHGDRYRRALGSASWARKPGSSTPLRVSLLSRPTGDSILVETDNGDNPRLQIDTFRAAFRPVHLVFTTASAAPVELAYGNPRAFAPRYDIELIRAQLQNAEKTNATLGPEVRAKGYKEAHDSFLSGGTWLWIALALVVAGLLWIVARLLPDQPPPPQAD